MLAFNKGSLLSANQTDFARDSDFFTSSPSPIPPKDSSLKATAPSKFEGTLTDEGPEPDFEIIKDGTHTKEPEDYDTTINLLAASLLTQTQQQPVQGTPVITSPEEPNTDLNGLQNIEGNSLLKNGLMGANIAAPIQTLKSILSSTQETPVISFLTGDLGKIEPSQVPEVVLSSPFIADALQANNTAQFMNNPQPLKQLLGELSFPPSILQKIQAANLNPDQMITPKELFQTLGVDPKRIETELTLLQQNLPIDGLRPYMERAAALQAKTPQTVKTAKPEAINTKDPEPKNPMAIQNNPKVPAVDSSIASNSSLEVDNDPYAPSKKSRLPSRVEGADKLAPQPAPITIINDNPNLDIATASTTPTLAPLAAAAPTDKPLNLARPVTQDPFAALKQGMDQPSIASVSFANVSAPQNTFNLNEAIAHLQTQRNATLTGSAPEISIPSEPSPIPHENSDAKMMQAPLFQPDNSGLNFTPNKELSIDLEKSIVTTTLGKLNDILPTSESTKGDAQDTSEQNEQQADTDAGSFIPMAMSHQNHTVSHKTEFNAGTPNLNTANATDNLKKIMEKATLLVKDGGGSIRLDMGTKELGHIDLAVDVKDNKLSIRIIAESEQAKHLITNELPKLRDALADQRLTLQNAEVGLRGQSNPWSNSSSHGQSGFSQGQNQNQGQSPFGSGIPTPKTLSRAALPGFQPRYRSNFSQTPGQIRVLV